MRFLYRFNKPEYIYQPKKLISRILDGSIPKENVKVQLPWKHEIEVNPKEDIGKSIYVLGLYEISLSELINRALPYCDEFIDVGANIGYFTSLALSNKQFKGRIHSFEPHPKIKEKLESNVKNWNENNRVTLYDCALSDCIGVANLNIPVDFENNEGIATLCEIDGSNIESIEVKMDTVDNLFNENKKYILKIDTEGHEASVLKGAEKLLASDNIKLIFFEEFRPYPAESFEILEKYGFEIRRIERGFLGPKLKDIKSPREEYLWEPLNFVAAKKDDQILKKIIGNGWKVFSIN